MTAPHWGPTKSSLVIPTVQFSLAAIPTIWSVVCIDFGRRIRGIASIAATVSNIDIPMGVVRSRSSRLRSPTIEGQSIEDDSRVTGCSVVMIPFDVSRYGLSESFSPKLALGNHRVSYEGGQIVSMNVRMACASGCLFLIPTWIWPPSDPYSFGFHTPPGNSRWNRIS